MYAPVQPLVLTTAEWNNADFALLEGEIAWEVDQKPNPTKVYMLRGDGAKVNGPGGYTRLRVSLAVSVVIDSSGNIVDIEDHINKIDGSAHGINTLIGSHNGSAEAHADIRSAAGSAQSKADTADEKIDTHAGITNGSAHGINTLIGTHNASASAHADIRARINDGLDDLNSALAGHRNDTEAHLIPEQIEESIAAHNEDGEAHPDIQDDIYAVQRSAGDLSALALDTAGEYLRIADVIGFMPEDLHELVNYQRMSDAEPEGDGGLREADHLSYQPAGNYQTAGDYAGQADFDELYGLVLSAYGDALRFADNEAGSAEVRLLDGLTAEFRELDRTAPDGAFMSEAVWADWTPL
jgi:hypothetical protein